MGIQDPATPAMQGIIDLHRDICFFMVVMLVFVIWMRSYQWDLCRQKGYLSAQSCHSAGPGSRGSTAWPLGLGPLGCPPGLAEQGTPLSSPDSSAGAASRRRGPRASLIPCIGMAQTIMKRLQQKVKLMATSYSKWKYVEKNMGNPLDPKASNDIYVGQFITSRATQGCLKTALEEETQAHI